MGTWDLSFLRHCMTENVLPLNLQLCLTVGFCARCHFPQKFQSFWLSRNSMPMWLILPVKVVPFSCCLYNLTTFSSHLVVLDFFMPCLGMRQSSTALDTLWGTFSNWKNQVSHFCDISVNYLFGNCQLPVFTLYLVTLMFWILCLWTFYVASLSLFSSPFSLTLSFKAIFSSNT